MSRKLSYLAEHHDWLPASQMGARPGRSTETALELLTEQIHTVWSTGNDKVATLLSMDVARAFPTVNHARLIHNLRKKRVPDWIVKWVISFVDDRSSTLSFLGRTTEVLPIRTGLPQGSPMSPILYLFFNAGLLELIERSNVRATAIGFVDDINLLAFGRSTEENCATLERIHAACFKWASRHGTVFAPEKYELIHLSRRTKRFNMRATMRIGDVSVAPKTQMRVLGLHLDPKLNWGSHIRSVKAKMATQTMALSRIAASTWGASFAKARQIYSAVIRPAITYASTIWHEPTDKLDGGPSDRLLTTQNKCLRTIAGAFKATPVRVLEAETFTSPLNVHLNRLQAEARMRMRDSGRAEQVRLACERVASRLRGSRGRIASRKPTPGRERLAWASRLILETRDRLTHTARKAPWDRISQEGVSGENAWEKREARKKALRTKFMDDWNAHWTAYRTGLAATTPAQSDPLDKKRLKWHKKLAKAESSVITQIRTEKIGLAKFLCSRKVPDFAFSDCPCGAREQTPRHVIMDCPLTPSTEEIWSVVGGVTRDYSRLMATPKAASALARWFIKSNLLPMFSLARTHLYGSTQRNTLRDAG